MNRATYYFAFVLILLVALIGRIYFWEDQARAGWIQVGDEDEYYRGAIHLVLQGDYYDDGQWMRPPVNSLYLAGAFALLGINVPAALLLETAVSLLNVALVGAFAQSIFRRRDYALAAAAAAALFLPWMAYASRLLAENLFTLFLILAFIFLVRSRAATDNRYLLLSGVALALATLTRPLLLYAIPLLFLWVLWERRKLGTALRAWLILFIGFAALVAPWTARNYVVYRQLVIIDTNGGVSFWFGTLLDPSEQKMQDVWKATLPNSALRQQAALTRGLENIRSAPMQWVGRMRQKVVGTFQLDTRNFVNNSILGPILPFDSVLYVLVADAQYILLFLFGLLGLALCKPSERNPLLLGWILYMILLSAVTVGNARFRIPMMVVAMVYAAPVLVNPLAALRNLKTVSRARKVFLAISASVFLLLIYSASYAPFLVSQFWLGVARLGKDEQAVIRAIHSAPENVLPLIAQGEFRLARGDSDGALAAFSQAVQYDAVNPQAQANRIALLIAQEPPQLREATEAAQQVHDGDWDNSQWYEWAWRHLNVALPNVSDMSIPAVGMMRGVYAAEEEDGETFRWTLQKPAFRLSNPGATQLVVRLRADEPKRINVFSDGEFLQSLDVSPDWETYSLQLKQAAGAQTLIEFDTRTTVLDVDNPYARGVAVSGIRLE